MHSPAPAQIDVDVRDVRALAHRQVAMLYKTELAIVRRKRASTVGETLAEIW
jgi:hypothetical protein